MTLTGGDVMEFSGLALRATEFQDANGNVLLGTATSHNEVHVYDETGLPDASGGIITLADDTTYVLFNAITLTDTLKLGSNTRITDHSIGNNPITSSASTIFSFQDANGISIFARLRVIGDGTNAVFGGTAVLGARFGMTFTVIDNVASCGTTTNLGYSVANSTISGFSTGLTLSSGLVAIFNATFLTADPTEDNVVALTIEGTWTNNIVDYVNGLILTKSNGYAFKVDNAVTADIRVVGNKYIGNTVLFDPAGLDFTDPIVDARDNPEMQGGAQVGTTTLSGNTTETTISTLDTYTSVGVASTPNATNERYSHSGNILTSTGLSPIASVIHVSGNVLMASGGAKEVSMGVYHDGVLIGEQTLAPDPTSTKTGSFGIALPACMQLGDTVEVKYKNVDDTVNLIIQDEHITVTS